MRKPYEKNVKLKEITLGKVEEPVAPLFALAKSSSKINSNASLDSIISPTAKLQNKTIQGKIIYRCY